MKDYTQATALRKVIKNADVKERQGNYYVLAGTAGNGTLGAISFLKKNCRNNLSVSVVSEQQYKRL
jgi:hypothetical protein